MIKVRRNIYLSEFEGFTFKQRLYYLWVNQYSVDFPNINKNPLKWCLLDLVKLLYVPVLYLCIGLISLYEAKELKTRYINDEERREWYKENCWTIEDEDI